MDGRRSVAVWLAGLLALVFATPPPLDGRSSGGQSQATSGLTQGRADGIILGRVVDGDTGGPVGGATVGLRGAGRPMEYVFADGDGRFVFREVAPGDYTMTSLLAGYLPAEYGQRRPGGAGRRLPATASQRVTDVTIRQWRFAAISGVVVDEVGEPVVGAQVYGIRVTMVAGRRVLANVVPEAITDDRGVYRLGNLSPGEYYVFAPSIVESVATSTANWYAEASAAPETGAVVRQALRESSAPTPSLTGFPVGEHVVSSRMVGTTVGPRMTTDGRLEVYRTIYHPSAATLDLATPVTVTSGEQRQGVDLQLVLEPALRISGEVVGPDGPAAHLGVRLLPDDARHFVSAEGFETAATVTGSDGRFTLLGVPPGRYTIAVLRVPQATSTANRVSVVVNAGGGTRSVIGASGAREVIEAADEPTLWAEQTLTVGDADVSGIRLALQEGARVSGRIEFTGARPAPAPETLARFAVRLDPVGGQRHPAYQRPPPAATDATFRTHGYPPGRYFVEVVAAPSAGGPWLLESVTLGGRDVTDEPLELEADDLDGLVITMTDQLGGITGSVESAPDGDGALVAIFPADYRAWIASDMPASRAGMAETDAEGRFVIANLRSGTYLAVALPSDAGLDLQDPEWIAGLGPQATRVDVPARSSVAVRLRIAAGRGGAR